MDSEPRKSYIETILTAPQASSSWEMYRLVREAAMKIVVLVPEASTGKLASNAATVIVHRRAIDGRLWAKATRADRARWYGQLFLAALGLVEWLTTAIASNTGAAA